MRRTPRRKSPDPVAAGEWHRWVVREPCAMCRAFPPDAAARTHRAFELRRREAHHVVPAQTLRREHLDAHLYDERNGLSLCQYHHQRHENGTQRIPRAVLPAAAFEFAAELGLDWLIDRMYPETGVAT